MSFTWDAKTQARIDKRKRKDKIITRIITWSLFIVLLALGVGIRIWIIGGWNECFWAEDTGVCLSILNSRK